MSKNRPSGQKGNPARTPAVSNPRQVTEQLLTWEGPVPPPAVIEAYERLVPGSAQIMWSNFDDQSQHRRELEKAVVLGSEKRADKGQFIAAFLLIVAIAAGVVVAVTANAAAGAAIVIGALGSGTAVYIAGGRTPEAQPETTEDDKTA